MTVQFQDPSSASYPTTETLAKLLPSQALAQRLVDVTVAAAALLVFAPLLVCVAALVRATSDGPILFRQTRAGQNGVAFDILKFRTMRLHQDASVRQASRNDARVTPVGRILRKTSLDELPQLINVLRGDMSLVGPRPHAVAHDEFYGQRVPGYYDRYRVRPGMTGLAQVRNLRGETETLDKMVDRVTSDLEYVRRNDVWLDLWIMVQTPLALFRGTRAY